MKKIFRKPLNTIKGNKLDADKLRYDLIPVEALEGLAKVLTSGAEKYGDRNWEKGIEFSRVYAALLRHLFAWWGGEDNDMETGESHLHHVACNTAFLQSFVARGLTELDDRFRGKEEEGNG